MLPMLMRRSMAKARQRRRLIGNSNGVPQPRPSAEGLANAVPYLQSLPRTAVQLLISAMECVAFENAEQIIKTGGDLPHCSTASRRAAAIRKGELSTSAKRSKKLPMETRRHLPLLSRCPLGSSAWSWSRGRPMAPGDVFGEVIGAPLPSVSTISAVGACLLWRLNKKSFDTVLSQHGFSQENLADAEVSEALRIIPLHFPLNSSFFATVPVISGLDKRMFVSLEAKLRPTVFRRGDVVFSKGSRGGDVHIVLSGEVTLFYCKDGSDTKNVHQSAAAKETLTTVPSGAAHDQGGLKGVRFLLGERPYVPA